jgi:hypothetical protein
MANPNIVNVQRILANTVTGQFISSNTVFVTNPASSGAVYKINSVTVTNIDGAAAVDKNSGFYMLENSTIGGAASANDDLSYTISFEQLYDS